MDIHVSMPDILVSVGFLVLGLGSYKQLHLFRDGNRFRVEMPYNVSVGAVPKCVCHCRRNHSISLFFTYKNPIG